MCLTKLSAMLFLLPCLPLQAATASVTQTLQANIAPVAAFSTTSYTFTLAKTGSLFVSSGHYAGFSASLTLMYNARTGSTNSTAGITMKANTDFTPAGGPSMSAGDILSYTCAGPTLGTGCSGTQRVSTTVATPVLSLPPLACSGGGSPCSNSYPNSANLSFFLPDNPRYRTGFYTTTLQFTISAI